MVDKNTKSVSYFKTEQDLVQALGKEVESIQPVNGSFHKYEFADLRMVERDQYPCMFLHFERDGFSLSAPLITEYRCLNGNWVPYIQPSGQAVPYQKFIMDTGASSCSIPLSWNPLSFGIVRVTQGSGANFEHQCAVRVLIDGYWYESLATTNRAGVCLLGLDVLGHFNITLSSNHGAFLVMK